jgi:hypothetical protein
MELSDVEERPVPETQAEEIARLAKLMARTTAARGVDVWAVDEHDFTAQEWAKMTRRSASAVQRNVRRGLGLETVEGGPVEQEETSESLHEKINNPDHEFTGDEHEKYVAPIHDLAERWDISDNEAEMVLEVVGYYEWQADEVSADGTPAPRV